MSTAGLTAPRIVNAEWRKQKSLRSTWWTLSALTVAIVVVGVFTAVGVAAGELVPTPADLGATGNALAGLSVAEIVAAVLGIMAVTGEYGSGVIRSSFTAVPTRTPVVLAKAGLIAAVVLTLSVAALAVTFVTNRILLASAGYDLPVTGAAVRELAGAAVWLAALAALAGALGWLTRGTAGAIGLLAGLYYGLPVLGLVLPDTMASEVTRFLPANAGTAMWAPGGGLPAWAAYLTVAAWVAALLILAVVLVRKRDV